MKIYFVLLTELPGITASPSDDREIVEGQQNLMYTCSFEGSPQPAISWFFNGQLINAESGVSINDNTLTIASPQVSNSGIYQCIVSNAFGDAQAAWLLEIRPSSKSTSGQIMHMQSHSTIIVDSVLFFCEWE